ncbi:zinc ribbon domain-containing protein [uncultured Kocuria sp.]|uniref:FmdB family zinc ribbon protein n=1 Tax=uncultured Kocuria sp. TaxID=259305 RepID=UPI0026295F82|nr:zinc ribbon domain-containing protein [uncultured Kocuria sp.]
MPIYEYRCPECGDFELLLGMGAATRESTCPGCGSPARRLMSAPGLSRTGTPAARLIERTERTAAEPDVVAAPPPDARRAPRTTGNPLHRRLPRP